MKESMWRTRSKAMESLLGTRVTSIRVTTSTMREKAMVRCFGLMEVTTKANGAKVCKKAKVIFSLIVGILSTPEEGEKKGVFKNNILV
jgi:hypothetical protein